MTKNKELKGVIFDVQHYTVNDGPGIRTELFLKGCNLRCDWCSNPESFNMRPQVGVFPAQCIGENVCGECVKACPKNEDNDMFIFEDSKIVSINRDKCDDCMDCFYACPSDALKQWGKEYTVEQAMEVILKDKEFYQKSGGGVTISGGEALLQDRFVAEIFKRCNEEGVHTCVESALHVRWNKIEKVLPYTDMIITDIKHLDNEKHLARTKSDNFLVLENIKKIVEYNIPVIIRVPLIPGFNDDKETVSQIGDFIANELNDNVVQVQLLRFRPLGQEKYKALSIEYLMPENKKSRGDTEDDIRKLAKLLTDKGIKAYAGTTNKIECKRF